MITVKYNAFSSNNRVVGNECYHTILTNSFHTSIHTPLRALILYRLLKCRLLQGRGQLLVSESILLSHCPVILITKPLIPGSVCRPSLLNINIEIKVFDSHTCQRLDNCSWREKLPRVQTEKQISWENILTLYSSNTGHLNYNNVYKCPTLLRQAWTGSGEEVSRCEHGAQNCPELQLHLLSSWCSSLGSDVRQKQQDLHVKHATPFTQQPLLTTWTNKRTRTYPSMSIESKGESNYC